MKATEIIKQLNWSDIFGNTSQYENLYCFLKNEYGIDEFVQGFYPKSKNRKLAQKINKNNITLFKKHAKKIWNLSNTGSFFDNGSEFKNIKEYIKKL